MFDRLGIEYNGAMGQVREFLVAAKEAASQGKLEVALDQLLTAWRIARRVDIANLIERVSTKIADAEPRVEGESPKGRQNAWIGMAGRGRAADLGRLLPLLAEVRAGLALERLLAIAARKPDPRIASALVDTVLAPPFQSHSSKKFWRRLFKLCVDHADPRTPERLRPLLEPGRLNTLLSGSQSACNLFRRGIEGVIEEITAQLDVVEATADERELAASLEAVIDRAMMHIDARSAAVKSLERTEADFLAAIAEEPGNHGIREVFADWLLEREDERGEFFTLQFIAETRELTRTERARSRALASKNWRRWLGPLSKMVLKDSVVWRRGMPVSGRARHSTPTLASALIGRGEWATFEVIDGGRSLPTALLRDDAMTSLRVIRGLRGEQARALFERRDNPLPRIEEVGIADLWRDRHTSVISDDDKSLIGEAPGLPRLRVLGLQFGAHRRHVPGPQQFDWLWSSPLGARLVELTVDCEPRYFAAWLDLLNTDNQLPLKRVDLVIPGFRLRVERRDEGFRHLAIIGTGSTSGNALLMSLERITPGTVSSLDASASSDERDVIEATARRLRIHDVTW